MIPRNITLERKITVVKQWHDVAERSGLSPEDLADCAIELKGDFEAQAMSELWGHRNE